MIETMRTKPCIRQTDLEMDRLSVNNTSPAPTTEDGKAIKRVSPTGLWFLAMAALPDTCKVEEVGAQKRRLATLQWCYGTIPRGGRVYTTYLDGHFGPVLFLKRLNRALACRFSFCSTKWRSGDCRERAALLWVQREAFRALRHTFSTEGFSPQAVHEVRKAAHGPVPGVQERGVLLRRCWAQIEDKVCRRQRQTGRRPGWSLATRSYLAWLRFVRPVTISNPLNNQ